MSAPMQLIVSGDAEVRDAIKAAANRLSGRQMELALVAGAMPVQNAAKANASAVTATLRRSIHIGGHTYEGAGHDVGGNSAKQVVIGTNLIYARIQEEGGEVSPVNAEFLRFEVGGEVVYTRGPVTIPAQSYMRRAFESEGGNAIREVGAAVRDLIAAGKG